MYEKRDDGIPVREACVKMVSGYEINMCFYAVSIAEGFRNGFSQKKINLDLERVSMLEIIQELTTNGLQSFSITMN